MQECYYFSVCSDWVLFIELQLLRNEKGINESELFRVVIIIFYRLQLYFAASNQNSIPKQIACNFR